ncbi:L,D-transpeptidase [Roseinatronobacter alkalisoli]|uniref:L,D-transpeptidase n=1 Tax=Roseinatronobacter alkalisoli TaxID=3028235 RepID=A0ABT5T8B9_9RHOB|nr:L,D-transpeptidase [Roseinatronobacter sp. HJB301]MDD7971319.1 L,D-transpeptidase [Roseinatronobacter sp. HJB301]
MNLISRRGFLTTGAAASALALGACESTSTAPLASPRMTEDGRPIATTRTEPMSPIAARYGIAPLSYEARPDGAHSLRAIGMSMIPPEFHRDVVPYATRFRPGTIVIDNPERKLFLVLPDGHALRYGIAVGREGFTWRGTGTIYRRAHWPTWTPTANMIRREPWLARFAGGMPGGPRNPLGARALYLMTGGRDQGYRIHGTPEWWLIGQYVSSGCIRMVDHDVIDLFGRVPNGTRVVTI